MHFICPKCKEKLEICGDNSAKCKNGHSFDRAKEGYYNLLLSSAAGTHGDEKAMVEARREFLSAGYYKPLAERVSDLAEKYVPKGVLLDCGCGEGYYTDAVCSRLSGRAVTVAGFDISKDAVRRAAKRNRSLELAVAGSYHIPMADGAVACVLDLFSPLARDEFYRVLGKDGVLIMAIPGENHLFALKEKIYDTPYKNEVQDTALEGFTLVCDEVLTFDMLLDSREAIASLFAMTPYAYRTSPEGKARVAALDRLTVAADFRIFVYRKNG